MENYNKKVRDFLGIFMDSYLKNGGISVRKGAKKYREMLKEIEDTGDEYQELYRKYQIYVMYLDAYKLSMYKQKQCIADDQEIEFFDQLLYLLEEDELMTEIEGNEDFLERLIEESYKFREMNVLGKIIVIKSLSEYENDDILQYFPIHEQDLDTYNIEVTLKMILDNIRNQLRHQKEDLDIDCKEAIMLNVVGFIQKLAACDYKNAEKLLLEIGKADYRVSKFLASQFKDNELFLDHIDLYENYSRDTILNELEGKSDFLKDAIWNIADVDVFKKYEGTSINTDEMDDCKDTEVMKKLVIKRNQE